MVEVCAIKFNRCSSGAGSIYFTAPLPLHKLMAACPFGVLHLQHISAGLCSCSKYCRAAKKHNQIFHLTLEFTHSVNFPGPV